MEWLKLADKLPTEIEGQQVNVLFFNPKWATPVQGKYMHDTCFPLRERLYWYLTEKDEYTQFPFVADLLPLYYLIVPSLPKQ